MGQAARSEGEGESQRESIGSRRRSINGDWYNFFMKIYSAPSISRLVLALAIAIAVISSRSIAEVLFSSVTPAIHGSTQSGGETKGKKSAPPIGQAVKAPVIPPKARSIPVSDDGIVEVEVTGVGATPEAAFDDAILSALRQVAGTFLRADTKVVNDQVVQDRIISHSAGFIESATKQGTPTLKGGTYPQVVIVRVRRGKVSEVLVSEATASAEVDGDSLYARVKAMLEQKSSGAELIEAVFDGFPSNVLKCEVAEGPTEMKVPSDKLDEGQVMVSVIIDIELDKEKWKSWCKGAREAFDAIASVKKTVPWNPKKAGAQRVSVKQEVGLEFISFSKNLMSEKTAKAEHLYSQGTGQVFRQLQESLKPLMTKTRVDSEEESLKDGARTSTGLQFICLLESAGGSTQVFAVPREMFSLDYSLSSSPLLSVDLVDTEGESLGLFVRHPNVLVVPEKSAVLATVFESGFSTETGIVNPNDFNSNFKWGCKASPMCWISTESDSEENVVILLPWLFAGEGSDMVLSSRMSIPFTCSIAAGELLRCKQVKAELGERWWRSGQGWWRSGDSR